MSVTQSQVQEISASIRALYRIIGKIIGRQIFDRVANDINLHPDAEKRRAYANQVIDSITAFRKELLADRDFTKIEKIMEDLFDGDQEVAVKLFGWILEAYLLLNQSSTASAEVTKPKATLPDRLLMSKLIGSIRTKVLQEKHLEKVFSKDFSTNLVLTAHPTAGIQPDYINHIKNMVNAVQKIAERVDPSEWESISKESEVLESNLADLFEDISLSISHMVRAKPYNNYALKPLDESANFLNNVEEAWDIIPAKIQALEHELKEFLGDGFRINPEFFRLHSWVARDIDGNPTVSREEHMRAILQEKLHFMVKYKQDVENLWHNLSDDFTDEKGLPTKTFFKDETFKRVYENILELNQDVPKPHQAYRVVLMYGVLLTLNAVIEELMRIDELTVGAFQVMDQFNVAEDLIAPLEVIRANKEGVNTKEIDLLIRKAQVFGDFGSHGHTRQGAEIIAKMTKYLSAIWDGNIDDKVTRVFREDEDKVIYTALKARITSQFTGDSEKVQHKLLQTFDLLELSELGAIRRQIISMNSSFEDMLNVLLISKLFGAFIPGTATELPQSRLEIVPLTEQIIDLRNSYQVTIDALANKAWHHYLIAHNGHFIKMRGPSDSGKQNGFVASQWEMFRSKQLDTIVVEIFNAYLEANLFASDEKLKLWKGFNKDDHAEQEIVNKAIERFEEFFASEDFDKDLWQRAHDEKGIKRVKMINFDGWGEPVERGGGLEFEDTVKCTQPVGSIAHYERTLQGGGAQQLASSLRTRQAVQDFINGVSEIAVRRFALDRAYDLDTFTVDPNFAEMMKRMVHILRSSLRGEVFGLDLEDDLKVSDEKCLRQYFKHVIKSPLVYLDLFNIASRPTSRSGSQIKELLDDAEYANSLDKLAANLPLDNVVAILGDVRAIPYAAMFSLLGGNHVSFYGYDKVLEDDEKFGQGKGVQRKTLIEWISDYYNREDDSQEARLVKHIIDSLERGVIAADQACYRKAHEIIEYATDEDYNSGNDLLILKLLQGEQSTLNFIAKVKGYKVDNPSKVRVDELMQANTTERDLLIARRNDAAVPRMGIAVAMNRILKRAKTKDINPLSAENIPIYLLDLLRKAFAAGASTFGNGCID